MFHVSPSQLSLINLSVFLLCAHIYSDILQRSGKIWTPDEIGSAGFTDKAKPARPLKKHHQPKLLHEVHQRAGKQKSRHTSPSRPHMLLNSLAQLRKRVPRQVKPLTSLWESGPCWWRGCSCISKQLNPMGSPYFCCRLQEWPQKEIGTHIFKLRIYTDTDVDKKEEKINKIYPLSDVHTPRNAHKIYTRTHNILIKIPRLLQHRCEVRAVQVPPLITDRNRAIVLF